MKPMVVQRSILLERLLTAVKVRRLSVSETPFFAMIDQFIDFIQQSAMKATLSIPASLLLWTLPRDTAM
jgi:hypothetical protein